MPRPKDKDVVNSTTREAIIQRESTWLNEAMEKSQNEGKEHYRALTHRSFDSLKRNRGSLRPRLWSDDDEAEVLAQWDRDSAGKPCRRPNAKEQYLWKTSARFLECLPTELIGMRYGLEYDTGEAKSQNWTENFCVRLVQIIAHPIFDNSPAKIALAIKFSVCSWQRLKWVIPDLNDLFLLVVQKVAESNDAMVGAKLVRDSIKKWRARWPQGDLPEWAQLLRAVVANGKRPVSDAESPHLVATQHLSVIVDSLDEITHGKLVRNHSVGLYERALKDIRSNIDLPTGKDPVDQLLAEGIIHNRRLRVLRDRHPGVNDIYEHVSRPQAVRPKPKDEYADIDIESSEDDESSSAEEQAEAAEAAQASRAGQAAKRKRGRPGRVGNTPDLVVEHDVNPGERSNDGGGLPPAKRPRGRPPKTATPAVPGPGEAAASPKPTGEGADVLQDAGSGDSDVPLVPMSLGRPVQERARAASVPDSIANPGGQQGVPVDPGFSLDNDDMGGELFLFEDGGAESLPLNKDDLQDGGFLDNDNGTRDELGVLDDTPPLPQLWPYGASAKARPTTSHSEELGQDTTAGEDGTDHSLTDASPTGEVATTEHGTDEILTVGRGIYGAFPDRRRPTHEATPPSADAGGSVSGGGPVAAAGGAAGSSPADGLETNLFVPRDGGTYHGASPAQAAREETEWPES
jgi:hypothetical protein